MTRSSLLLAVDARQIYRPDRRGTGKNLIDLYRHVAEQRPLWHILMFHQQKCLFDPFGDLPNVDARRIDIPGDRFDVWQQVRLPLAARWARADVLHCPANTAPRHPLVPMVVTIHDLIPLDPRWRKPTWRRWDAQVASAAGKARRIIAPSRFTRGQIVHRFGIPVDNITVNPWAADRSCTKVADPVTLDRVRARYGLAADQPYVFAFGSGDPRKNTARVIEAWGRVSAWVRDQYGLLIVGLAPAAVEAFRRQARGLGVADVCRLHGFADEADLPALLSGAAVLCYVSVSEGFGLPILDAFACDTAVLTGNTTSLPEVAGDAAVQVDPEDTDAIAAALTELLTDDRQRAGWIERGRERLRQFTWPACAERACRVFEKAMTRT